MKLKAAISPETTTLQKLVYSLDVYRVIQLTLKVGNVIRKDVISPETTTLQKLPRLSNFFSQSNQSNSWLSLSR